MKKFAFGVALGLLMFPLFGDSVDIIKNKYSNNKLVESIYMFTLVPRYGASDVFLRKCTKDVKKNGHGWVYVARDYFQCGKLSIWISDHLYGEYAKPRDPELEKKACKDCTF